MMMFDVRQFCMMWKDPGSKFDHFRNFTVNVTV